MIWNILLLLLGFVLLIKGADFFVDGSSSVARLFGVPGFVIGLSPLLPWAQVLLRQQ